MNTDVLDAALDYYDRGFTVIPIKPGTKTAEGRWKKFQLERPSEEATRRMFSTGKASDLAVLCGPASGNLLVRDYDQESAYEDWANVHPALARSLPTVVTGRGRHVYLCVKPGHELVKGVRKGGDGELRGQGGYVLAPPTKHPLGRGYDWQVPLGKTIPCLCPVESGLFLPPLQSIQKHTDAIECGGGCGGDQILVPSSGDEVIDLAITRSLPNGPGQRNQALFTLARNLKAIPCLHDAQGKDLEHIVRRWFDIVLPVIGTKDFTTTLADFLVAWGKVQFPAGCGPMEGIVERARTEPYPEVAKQFDNDSVQFLVALCWHLQLSAGQSHFFLACRTAGVLIGVSHTLAAEWLRFLVNYRILELVERGGPSTMKATRYRFPEAMGGLL